MYWLVVRVQTNIFEPNGRNSTVVRSYTVRRLETVMKFVSAELTLSLTLFSTFNENNVLTKVIRNKLTCGWTCESSRLAIFICILQKFCICHMQLCGKLILRKKMGVSSRYFQSVFGIKNELFSKKVNEAVSISER